MEDILYLLLFILEHPFLSIIIVILICEFIQSIINSTSDNATAKINNTFDTNINKYDTRGILNKIIILLFKK